MIIRGTIGLHSCKVFEGLAMGPMIYIAQGAGG